MKAIDIKITVHGQTVTADGAATVMSGSRNLYRLAFEFEKPAEAARYVQIEKDGERSVYLPIDGEPVALPNEFCAKEGVIRVSVFADDLITTNAAVLPVIRSAYSADVPAEGADEAGALRKCVFTPTDETAVTVLKKDAEGFKAFCGGEYVRVGSKNDYTDADKALVSLIPSKADEADLEDCLTTVGNILRDKVDKIEGKGLSTNDYTDADVKWLNTDIPEILTEDYSNIVKLSQKINLKEDKVEGKGLSTNDYTDADKAYVQGATDGYRLIASLSAESETAAVTQTFSEEYDEVFVEMLIPAAAKEGRIACYCKSGANTVWLAQGAGIRTTSNYWWWRFRPVDNAGNNINVYLAPTGGIAQGRPGATVSFDGAITGVQVSAIDEQKFPVGTTVRIYGVKKK